MVRNSVELLWRCRSSAEQGWQVANNMEKADVSCVFYESVFMGKYPVPKYPSEIKNDKANNKVTPGMKKN